MSEPARKETIAAPTMSKEDALDLLDTPLPRINQPVTHQARAAEPEPEAQEIEFESAADLLAREIPEPLWHVPNMIAGGGCTIVGAQPKSGKSILMLDLALATVSGGSFLGRPVETPGKVLLLDSETPPRLMQDRINMLRAGRGLSPDAVKDLLVLRSLPPLLDEPENLAALQGIVWGEEPALVVIDPVIRFHSRDENSASEIAPFLRGLRSLTHETGTTLIVVHHMSKMSQGQRLGQALRGSSDFHGWYDTALGVTREGSELTLAFEARACGDQPNLTAQLEIDDDIMRFRAIGPAAFKAAKADMIHAELERNPDGLTTSQIRSAVRANDVTVRAALGELQAAGLAKKCRKGHLDVWLHTPQMELCCTPGATGSASSATAAARGGL